MKALNALVIDDQKANSELLKLMILDYCPYIKTVSQAHTISEALNQLSQKQMDVIFLDIQMKNEIGFDLLKKLKNYSFEVIVVTAFKEYAIDAFKNNVIDYILKPVDITELVKATNKVYNKLKLRMPMYDLDKQQQFSPKIPIITHNNIELLDEEIILYLKSEGRYTELHLKNGQKKVTSKNLGSYENKLDPKVFFRVHKSYIINTKHITSVEKKDGYYCLLNGKLPIPISKRKKEAFISFLGI